MTLVSYAQNFEDILLWRALRHVEKGFYIDVGAAHPDIDSVTRSFYDRGWSGINIEPTPEFSARLVAARPRDVNLKVALGAEAGLAELFVAEGTGLSTLDPAGVGSIEEHGFPVRREQVTRETLAEICRCHAPPVIHFLKIDVEGTERAVIAGADLKDYRPWIILVEATAPMSAVASHGQWEPMLQAAGYHFVWFDGLNRFYVSDEKLAELSHAFLVPPNVFDDFIRAADSEWARRIHDAETRAAALLKRAVAAEQQIAIEAARAAVAISSLSQARKLEEDLIYLRKHVEEAERDRIAAEVRAQEQEKNAVEQSIRATAEMERAALLEGSQREAREAFDAIIRSTSWRVTAPLRRLRAKRAMSGPTLAPLALPPQKQPLAPVLPSLMQPITFRPLPPRAARGVSGQNRRVVHQFHAGSAVSDAVTNSLLLTRRLLRSLGYVSDIFVEHRDERLSDELRLLDELPKHDRYVLIAHHSMGYDGFHRVATLPCPKILMYHNITPPDLLAGDAYLQRYAELGRLQLAEWRGHVVAALADSEFNALELRQLGFDPVQVCCLLFDPVALLARAVAEERAEEEEPFTILFVGRVCRSKGQIELVEAYAAFRAEYGTPSRLVLIGRHGGDEDGYFLEIRERIADLGLEDSVLMTGLVSDAVLHSWYAKADIYLSLSRHEGFGVPLVEAMAHRVPVLALASGAVAHTLVGSQGLFREEDPEAISKRLLAAARDEALRRSILVAQGCIIERFSLEKQQPVLLQALGAAGAAPPIPSETRELLCATMQFTVMGHVNGNYSLAAINRSLALCLEASCLGSARLVPVEEEATDRRLNIPDSQRCAIEALIARQRPGTGPEVVISQHYPVHVPADKGDLALAYVFWEESIIPRNIIETLNNDFRGVLSPSRFVTKVLIDSGLTLPIHYVGFTPNLGAFRTIADQRRRSVREARPLTFLHVSSAFPRKGIDLLLEAYRRAFRATDDVRLIIKCFPNPHNNVERQVAALRAADPEAPAIILIDREMTESELLELYRDADVMVLPTRGEGLNLPAAEALASGLSLIVTGYGGHMDFCCNEAVRLLEYDFSSSESHLSSAGSVWVEPHLDDLTDALRTASVTRPPAEPRKGIGEVADFASRVTNAAADILLTPPSPGLRVGWISSWDVRCGIAEYSRHLIAALPVSAVTESVTIFADDRTAPQGHLDSRIKVLPCWELGLDKGVFALSHAVAAIDPQVLVIQHQPGLVPWGRLAEFLGSSAIRARSVVIVLHSTRRLTDLSPAERRPVLSSLSEVGRILVHTVDDLNRLKAFDLTENVALLPHGADVSAAPLVAPRHLKRDSFPLIGCYGFFLPEKGIRQLVAAVAQVRQHYPSVRLRLVNARYDIDTSLEEIACCRELASKAGVADAIEWHTEFLPQAQSLALLADCDVVALPYQTSKESSSAALRSALTAGRPVVVTPILIFDEAWGAVQYCKSINSSDIAETLLELLGDPERRAELQLAGRGWLEQRAWAEVSRRMHDLLVGLHVQEAARSR
ncbi:FkbM family methyltransferase [Acidisoma sp. S159]|uniref:FkbM family methyltransferase n=1 Tax=Acidisoma sp. S159 TaxID=1747225 RepID=UPI00131BAC81|nr:FkbM family methyltransferase [Acidisoma sp. S159]